MIYGIGTDIVAIERVKRLLDRHGERAVAKILAPSEQEEWQQVTDPSRFLAKRWVAKEAFSKALGTGVRPPALLPAIAIVHDELGKPLFKLSSELESLLQQKKLHSYISLSDEAEYAVAFVILEHS